MKTQLNIIIQALQEIYAMLPETGATMTATEYVAELDAADVGTEAEAATSTKSAAAMFAPINTPHNGAPVYAMTPQGEATGFTIQQYALAGWSYETLLDAGHIYIVQPEVVEAPALPNAPTSAPTPPPSPAASSAPAAPPTAQNFTPAAVMVDADGLPWDERIHAGTRTRTAKDVWTKKKGTGEVYYNQVVTELRAANPAPSVAPFVPLAAAPAPAAPAPAAPPAAVAAPAPAPAPPAPGNGVVSTFADLCKWATPNGVDMKAIAVASIAVGGPAGIGEIANPANAANIPATHAYLVALKG